MKAGENAVKFIRVIPLLLLLVLPVWTASLAEPYRLQEDLTEEIHIPYDENNPEGPSYRYRYSYPQIDPLQPGADQINIFYAAMVDDARDFGVPILADYFRTNGAIPAETEITYEITCNDGDYLSLLLHTREVVNGEATDFYTGHTFSRSLGKAGATLTLPQLLQILESAENDVWLQERQTARADALVRSMVWDQIEENEDAVPYFEDFSREAFDGAFYPEEDFFLNAQGDPVFFLQPGVAASESAGLLTFPLSLEIIWDEM